MEKDTQTPEYEMPRIDDHGDLAELTAAVGKHGHFDSSFKAGEEIPENIGSLP
jgi:hypothetical protein